MVIKAAVTTLRQPSCWECQAMTTIVMISCVKFYLDKGLYFSFFCLFTKYLTYCSAGVGSQVHGASTEGKLHKRPITPIIMADQAVNTAVQLLPNRWPSNLHQLQHCPDVWVTLLYGQKRSHLGETWPTIFISVCLGMLYYLLWGLPVRGQTVTCNLNTCIHHTLYQLRAYRDHTNTEFKMVVAPHII